MALKLLRLETCGHTVKAKNVGDRRRCVQCDTERVADAVLVDDNWIPVDEYRALRQAEVNHTLGRLECGHEVHIGGSRRHRCPICADGRRQYFVAVLLGDTWVESATPPAPKVPRRRTRRTISVQCDIQRLSCSIYGHDTNVHEGAIVNRNQVKCVCGEVCNPGEAVRRWCKTHKHTYWCKIASR